MPAARQNKQHRHPYSTDIYTIKYHKDDRLERARQFKYGICIYLSLNNYLSVGTDLLAGRVDVAPNQQLQ